MTFLILIAVIFFGSVVCSYLDKILSKAEEIRCGIIDVETICENIESNTSTY
ncbi:MAG: hypothetical protein GY841_12315 [FCB group bacterium]|nr:hypothetical protein [FCB group bacterium]